MKPGQVLSPPKPNVQSTLKDFQPTKENYNKQERAIFLLAEGLSITKIALILNEKYDTIQKRAKRAAKKKILNQNPLNFPATYEKGALFANFRRTSSGQVSSATQKKPISRPDIATPHRFQIQYFIGSSSYRNALQVENLQRRYHFDRFDDRENLSAVWGTKTLTISIKESAFCKGSSADKIVFGIKTAQEYADAHNSAGARLRFRRLLGRIEWVIEDKLLSDRMVAYLGLKAGEWLTINKARFVVDLSHPDRLELNAKFPYPIEKPTENVETLEFLLDREKLLKTIAVMKERMEQQETEMMVRDQKMNILEAKIRGLEGKR